MKNPLSIIIDTDDQGVIETITFEDKVTNKKDVVKKFTHPKGSPPSGAPTNHGSLVLTEYTGGLPSHYCVTDPSTGNLWCIDIP